MKRLVVVFLALVLTFSISTNISAQRLLDVDQQLFVETKGVSFFPLLYPSEYDFTGGGARAEGMGNAFYALADDVSALSWNPAGLYGQDQPVFGFGYSTFTPKSDISNSALGQSFSFDETFGGVSLVSFSAPIRIKGHPFTFAASYSRSDDEFDYNRSDTSGIIIDSSGFRPPQALEYLETFTRNYRSSTDIVHFGFGTRVSQNSSIGASLSIFTNQSTTMYAIGNAIDSFIDFDLQTKSQNVDVSVLDTSKYSGVRFTVGYKIQTEKLSAGLVLKSPFTLQQKTNRTVFAAQRVNDLVIFGSEAEIHFDRILSKIDIPITIGGGVSTKVNEKLTLALDLEFSPFSGGEVQIRDSIRIIPGEKDVESFSSFDLNWKDVFAVRLGGEYNFTTSSKIFPIIPVRAGFAYLPTPTVEVIDVINNEPVFGDQLTNIVFSFGTGVKWSKIYIDASYSLSTGDYNGTLLTNNFNGDFQSSTSDRKNGNFNFTFTGFF